MTQGTARIGRMATDRQIEYINKLAEQVGKPVPAHVDFSTWSTAEASEMIDTLKGMLPSDLVKMASDKQVAYVSTLLAEREVPQDLEEIAALESWTSEQASELIRGLKVAPRKPRDEAVQVFPNVPDGRYAIPNSSGKGDLVFWKVWTRRDGSRGVDLQISDDYLPVARAQAQGVLERIALDPKEASAQYGKEIGSCGVCGRTLTDETSREIGIGPVCRRRF